MAVQRRSLPSPKRFAQAGRVAQRFNVREIVRFASSLAAALLDGLFEHPANDSDSVCDPVWSRMFRSPQ